MTAIDVRALEFTYLGASRPAVRDLPFAVNHRESLGSIVGKSDWNTWLLILVAFYPAVAILVFLEDVNENIRYVRHQMRVSRVAAARVSHQVAKYENPDKHFPPTTPLSASTANGRPPTEVKRLPTLPSATSTSPPLHR